MRNIFNIINKHRFAWMVMWALLGCTTAVAQEPGYDRITGKVVDQYGNPVSDVVITMKHSDYQFVTDQDGTFEFQYKKGEVLCLSHPDLLYKEIKINRLRKSNVEFKVTMQQAFVRKPEVINRAYDDQDADSYIGSSSTVYTNKLTSSLATTIIPSLQGRLAGLKILQSAGTRSHQTTANYSTTILWNTTGTMGNDAYSDNTQFSIYSRNQAPVVVLDGVQRELYSIDPDALESVSLQKDALSSMFLGMRSSRGALLLTTKEPVKEGFQFSFTGRLGVQSSVKKPKPLEAYQYAYLLNEALLNDGSSAYYSYEDFEKFRTGSSPYTHPNVDWYNTILNHNSTIQYYNINATGGGKYAQYFVSLGWVDENGLFKNAGGDTHDSNLTFDRYMLTSKVNINITSDFTAKVTLMGRIEEGTQPGTGYSSILSTLYSTPNNAYPVYNPDGSWGGNSSFTTNLLERTIQSGYIIDSARDVFGSINLNYDFHKVVPGLSARVIGSVTTERRNYTTRSKQAQVFEYTVDDDGNESYNRYGTQSTQSNSFSTVNTYQQMYGQFAVDYDRTFGKHGVKATLMGDTKNVITDWNLPYYPSNVSIEAAYNYDGKYFVQASAVESYFNRYAPGKRWGLFYAFGLGWEMSKEDFLKDLDWLDELKLRGVWGKTGNGIDNSGYYLYYQQFTSGSGYSQGSNQVWGNGETESSLANPNITWEKGHKLSVGVDLGIFHRLRVSGDFYWDNYYDLLQTRGKSIELIGQSYPSENIGKTRYYGGELNITYQDHVSDFNYYITGNISWEQSKLLFKDEQVQKESWLYSTNRPTGVIWGLIAEGFFQTQEEVDSSPVIDGYTNIQPGDIKYRDLNNDGVIDDCDKTVIGGEKPLTYFGIDLGFEWRGLELSMLWQGVINRDVMMYDYVLTEGFQTYNQKYGQAYEPILGRWTPETADTATFPRLSAGGSAYNRGGGYGSSFWLRNGNFIRLKDINIGYNLPDSFCRNYLGGVRVKIFVSGQNLFTISGNSLIDPEVSFTSYPLQRCLSTGINIKF